MLTDEPIFRRAVQADEQAIRRLIWEVKINPIGIDWRQFMIAVDRENRLIGCGQVKFHRGHIKELASIAVIPERRGEGIARQIIEYLILENPGPLYLTCRSKLGPFYTKFGFRALEIEEMPGFYRRLASLARILGYTGLMPASLLVMGRAINP